MRVERRRDFAARGARGLLQARFEIVDRAVAILDFLAQQLAELVELIVDALVDLRETLFLRFAHARELGFEALR